MLQLWYAFQEKKNPPYMKVEVPPMVMFKAHCMLEVANLGWMFDLKIFSGNQTSTNCYYQFSLFKLLLCNSKLN